MKCSLCGQPARPGARFCRSCGRRLAAAQAAACPTCGQVVRADARFCPRCGRGLADAGSKACPHCGQIVRPGSRFCAACGRQLPTSQDTVFGPIIRQLAQDFVGRQWLDDEVDRFLHRQQPYHEPRPYLVIVGLPGSGKTAYLAHLVATRGYLHHFMRDRWRSAATWASPRNFTLSLGAQLMSRYGQGIFAAPGDTSIDVRQTVERAGAGAHIAGIRIQRLVVSPFRAQILRAVQRVGALAGEMVGVEIGELVPLQASLSDLVAEGLINPLWRLYERQQEQGRQSQVVVLIDALDEAAAGRGETILDALPGRRELPLGVSFVITSRPGGHLDRLPDKFVIELGSSRFARWQRGDVQLYVDRLVNEPAVAGALRTRNAEAAQAFVQAVVARSQGNFEYLHQLRKALLAGDIRLLDPTHIPPGLDGIYSYFLQRIKTRLVGRPAQPGAPHVSRDWLEVYRPILGVLAVAREALSVSRLATLSGVGHDHARATVSALEQFLEAVQQGPRVGYRIYHASFSEFLLSPQRNPREYLDVREQHGRIAAAYGHQYRGNWPAVSDDYGLRYLADHLLQAGAHEALYALVDRPLRQTKLRRFHSDVSFNQDVAVACIAAERDGIAGLPCLVAYSLLGATLRSLAGRVPGQALQALAYLGQSERARDYASMMADVAGKAETLRLIATAQRERGERQQALDTLTEALETASTLQDEGTEQPIIATVALEILAYGLTTETEPLLSRALAAAETAFQRVQVSLPRSGAAALLDIADHLAKVGHHRRAGLLLNRVGKIIDESEEDWQRIQPLTDLARTWLELGNREEALRLVRRAQALQGQLDDESTPAWLASHSARGVAAALARLGDFEAALEIARTMSSGFCWLTVNDILQSLSHLPTDPQGQARASFVLHMVEALAEARLEVLGDRAEYYDLMRLQAEYLARLGRVEEALAFLERMPPDTTRALARAQVAAQLTRQGRLDAALQLAEAGYPAIVLTAIAGQLASDGDLEQALKVTQRLPIRTGRPRALWDILDALPAERDPEHARTMLRRILVLARQIADHEDRARTMASVAVQWARLEAYAESQQAVEEALNAVEWVGFGWPKIAAQAALLIQQAVRGEHSQRQDVLERLSHQMMGALERAEHPWRRDEILEVVAREWSRAGDMEQAGAVVGRIQDPLIETEVLLQMADDCEYRGQADDAVKLLHEARKAALRIESGWQRDMDDALSNLLVTPATSEAAIERSMRYGAGDVQARNLREIGERLARLGDIKAAARVVKDLGDSWQRLAVEAAIAQTLALAGRTKQADERFIKAITAVNDMQGSEAWDEAYIAVVVAFMPVMALIDVEEAVELGKIDPEARLRALAATARLLVETEEVSGAIRVMEELDRLLHELLEDPEAGEVPEFLVEALAIGAQAWMELKDTERAGHYLSDALTLSSHVDDDMHEALLPLVEALCTHGALPEAAAVAMRIEDARWRWQALIHVGRHLIPVTQHSQQEGPALVARILALARDRTREHVLLAIAALAPALAELEDAALLGLIGREVERVEGWWGQAIWPVSGLHGLPGRNHPTNLW